jgi:sialate O-acetylesterase
MKNRFLLPAVLSLIALAMSSARADVKLPAIFSDHMVLQQNESCALWGWADPGEQVTVTIAGKSRSIKAGKDGRWSLKLPELKAGGPHTLVVQGNNSITIQDVLVGEVWLGSGQSNMGWTVAQSQDFEGEKARANLPQIRMFTVERTAIPTPQEDCKGRWVVCAPDTVGNFSAALYFHGRELHAKLGVPMGLINSSWGGTPIEAWISAPAQSSPKFAPVHEPWTKQLAQPWDEKKEMAEYEKRVALHKLAAAKAKKDGKTAPRAPLRPTDPRLSQHRPANLFNGMIAPIAGYTLRGAVWYQGESNANKPFADLYAEQLEALIQDWRSRWKSDFAFAWVQLPDFKAPQKEPVEEDGWNIIREEMLHALKIKNTGMAIALGLGEANDIHPKNKQDVGRRLAAWALGDVYGLKGIATSGPLPAGHRIRGGEVVISFRHTDGGLRARGGELKGFAIAGADRKFVWANARIEGNKVVVWHPDVKDPKAVRYAWAANPIWSLENGAGLPASPFRTDQWK